LSRNKDRLGMGQSRPDAATDAPPTVLQNDNPGFAFVVPTEFVALPSEGRYYPPQHPLHGETTIEIRQMTAKEEDMLTSKTLLKKGVALDRVIQSLIVERTINAESLLVGDRNAIIIAMRVSGYGREYQTSITCPHCGATQQNAYDLNDATVYTGEVPLDMEIQDNQNGTFDVVLPRSGATVTMRLLTGHDENRISKSSNNRKKAKQELYEQAVTTQLSHLVLAVNGDDSVSARRYLVENIPSLDSRYLRNAYRVVAPNVELNYDFQCDECGHEQLLEVPLSANFFWPDS